MNQKLKFSSFSLVFFLTGLLTLSAQVEQRSYYADKGLVPVEQQVDMQELKLKASFVPEEKLIQGEVKHTFKVLRKSIDSLKLNAVRMQFDQVELNGKSVEYRKTEKQLILYFEPALNWGEQHSIRIQYQANPKVGLYFVGWNDTTGRSRKQIWTQGQGINNRHWIPMYDEKNDKIISEIEVEFDADYQVLSNGEKLKEKKLKNGNKLWHYRISRPHASYLIMLGIGKYGIEKRKSASGVEMDLYYYPDQPEQVEPTYRYSVEMFDFFENEIGVPYPWKTYAQIPVQDFMYGAMENTTATIFGDFYLVDERTYLDRNYVRVNAHELAHQWFGDMVTARSSAHHWLQESFATHYDMMYQGEAFGKDHFDWVRRNYNDQAIEASKNDLKPIAHSAAGTVRHYPKGAFVLQMLKEVVGRDQFNAAIKYYLEKHAYGNVDSKDLLVAFFERLGMPLNWFWEEWVYRGGEPNYQIGFKQYEHSAVFTVEQVQEQNDLLGLFKMPIDFQLYLENGEVIEKTVWIENQFHQVEFKLEEAAQVSFALFDPNNRVMKSVSFPKSTEMLKAQAAKATHMLDRYDALVALADKSFPEKSDFLLERFKAEEFHGIKGELIKQLMPQMNDYSEQVAKLAIKSNSTEVKEALLNNTLRISQELEGDYRKLLSDSSYQVVEKALELLGFYYPAKLDEYLEETKNEKGNRAHNIRISWLKLAYLHRKDPIYLQELIDYCSNSYEFLTRVKAAKALKELNYLDEKSLSYLLDATLSFNNRLKGPVSKVIDHFFEQAEYKGMILSYVSRQTWTDWEFRRVNKYLLP
ncbi:MAG: M1 family metallopeptidase [Vicingaceae bacterium]